MQDLHVFSCSAFVSTPLFLWAFKTVYIIQSIFASYSKLIRMFISDFVECMDGIFLIVT